MSIADRVSVVFPSGMLGAGIDADSVQRAVDQGVDAVVIDAGSTDSGPYYLGAAQSKSSAAAVERDLRILLLATRRARIPLVVSSCATSGTDAGVDWTADIVLRIAASERLSFTLARIYSEQSHDAIIDQLAAGRIHPLTPAGELDKDTLAACTHIVGLMGHEPIAAGLDAGADVVLAGRATDTALVAAVALRRGLAAGPVWHAAKTAECGDLCTTNPRGGGVLVHIDADGFTVEPLDPDTACTPATVAAHMLYENADPFRLTEPSGVLDTTDAIYEALDPCRVRVTGSRFEPAAQLTIKLEGSGPAGYETMSMVGIADPAVLAHLDTWLATLEGHIRRRVTQTLHLEPDQYALQLRAYGDTAVLGKTGGDTHTSAPREVGVVLRVRAQDQSTATGIAKTANPLLLHLPGPGMNYLPSYAFLTSPAEIERGQTYEFRLQHVIDVDTPDQLVRTVLSEVRHA